MKALVLASLDRALLTSWAVLLYALVELSVLSTILALFLQPLDALCVFAMPDEYQLGRLIVVVCDLSGRIGW